jgi:glutamine cyclotransferase
MRGALLLVAVLIAAGGPVHRLSLAAPQTPARLPIFGYTVVRAYPHDPAAFTQGLEYVDGLLYEGTGLRGRSSIRKVRLETGEVLQKRDLGNEHFGEGITLFGGRLFQLTWQSGTAFVYDRATFRPIRSFGYQGEGWGLTHDRTHLIMSDGTEFLRVLDPSTFREQRRVRVTAVGQPLRKLNELEYVKGEVLANVWMTDYIARIDPESGRVNAYIDLRGLLPFKTSGDAVLNGIAYDATSDRLFVTGKLWPRVFEIRLTPPR